MQRKLSSSSSHRPWLLAGRVRVVQVVPGTDRSLDRPGRPRAALGKHLGCPGDRSARLLRLRPPDLAPAMIPEPPPFVREDSKATIETFETLETAVAPLPWWQRDRIRLAVCCWSFVQLGWVEASVGPLICAFAAPAALTRQ